MPADGGGIIREEDNKRDRSWSATSNRRAQVEGTLTGGVGTGAD
jgi:hypothetical protein